MADEPTTALGKYLKDRGITQSAFAIRIGRTQPAVARYINGTRTPDWETMRRIASATDGELTPNDFLERLDGTA